MFVVLLLVRDRIISRAATLSELIVLFAALLLVRDRIISRAAIVLLNVMEKVRLQLPNFDLCLHFYLAFSITTTHFSSLFTIFTFITSDWWLGVQIGWSDGRDTGSR